MDTKRLLQLVAVLASLLPEAEDLEDAAVEFSRSEAFAPILAPTAFQAAQHRLATGKELLRAAALLRARLDSFVEAVEKEGNPVVDQALLQHLRAVGLDL